ncbi:DegT/DnrJ/EryC1/StrS family aminotransferase [Stenotrophomonas sp. SRS1]|uniref:DegT/DnrJ/EryC1/StrS family aminotransferase n=1 Tax=Stenotrophomonas sp. SRS1 TaxID=2870345 RepID=UPI002237D3A7|nr:DegT/DnrJ/EryC1/StrS family aminotransferase [Stenotrophomonas sp. SRS1]MCW6029165.1 DegT/DnrJ/EryC1/StrS family aminotransferase [Stenotrophomonas sp. SRS1]
MPPEAIPVNSLSRHIEPLKDALAAAATEVVGSGYFVLGPNVRSFESAFANYCGVEHCISVANGTDALELSLRSLGISTGDRVAVVANAAMYGTSAALACGAEPVFIDVLAETATMDPAKLEAAFGLGVIKAVIVTHLYGQLAAIKSIAALCRSHGAGLIEDCAQAHGARNSGGLAGSFGDIASFSFYPTKNLGALGDGGAVVTRREDLAERVRMLRQYGWTQKYTNGLAGGRNSRLDEIQASMLLLMLPHLDQWNERRREVALRYSSGIKNPKIRVNQSSGASYVAHLYVLRSEARSALQQHLASLGIQTDIHYPIPDHRQPCHGGRYADLELPVTELDCTEVITLPCFPELTDVEVDRVIEACNSF